MNARVAKSLTVIAVTLFACTTCPGAVDDPKEEVVKKELKKFEGMWALTSAERNGEKAPAEAIKDFRLVIKGNKLAIRVGGPPLKGTLTVDPSKKPRAYDATIAVDDRKRTSVGIYEFDGDTLKICFTDKGAERPKEFSTKGGTEERPLSLHVYKRPVVAGDAKEEVVEEELKKFEGTWALTSAERNEEKAPAEAIMDFRLVVHGNELTIRVGGPPLEGTLTVDPSKKPMAYDATIAINDRERTSIGIYEFDGDKLKICFTDKDGERPKEFITKGGTEEHPLSLHVYKRLKP